MSAERNILASDPKTKVRRRILGREAAHAVHACMIGGHRTPYTTDWYAKTCPCNIYRKEANKICPLVCFLCYNIM